MSIAIVDIETPFITNLGVMAIEKIFCIGVTIDDQPTKLYSYVYHPLSSGTLNTALLAINSCDLAVFHNGCKFDIPVLEHLLGAITVPIHDTLIISKLMFTKDQLLDIDLNIPDFPKALYGSYSLKAFGYRLGVNKGEFTDFSEFCTDMMTYLEQDCIVTKALYSMLRSQPSFPAQNIIDLEQEVASLIFQQEVNGFYFDIDAATTLNTKMLFEKQALQRKLQKTFRPQFLPNGPVTTPAKPMRRKRYIKDENYTNKW